MRPGDGELLDASLALEMTEDYCTKIRLDRLRARIKPLGYDRGRQKRGVQCP
jgi:hypothetical protein